MSKGTLTVNVFFPWGDNEALSCRLHKAEKLSELLMDPVGFYQKYNWNHQVPVFPHYEMELLTDVWTDDPDRKIHWRESDAKPGMRLVCLAIHIPTIEAAKQLFKVWCAGTAYTMLTGESFDSQHKGLTDLEFFANIEEQYGISIRFAS